MTIMTRKQASLLDQLVAVAGDPGIVEEALRTLNDEARHPPAMRSIIRRILEIRYRRHAAAHAG